MVCVYCNNKTDVINSRPQKRLGTTWRRRQCKNCGAIFTTLELPDLTSSVRFKAKSGSLHTFERDRLFMSIVTALGHRTDAVTAATALTATVTAKVLKTASSGIIERSALISTAYETLQVFDQTAATLYAAYHPNKERF